MVNNIIVSRFVGPPLPDENNRKLPNGPLYPPKEVLELLNTLSAESVIAWTDKCIGDLQDWSLDADDLLELLGIAVSRGRFRGSEWCIQQPGGPWAACDAYTLTRREYIEKAYKEMDIEYYLKFAVSKTGALMLIISCHPPENRS